MLDPRPSEESSVNNEEKLLSRHFETWGPRKTGNMTGDGWSQISYNSSEMGNVASPFDDIGFLAGGTGNMNAAPKSALNFFVGDSSTEHPNQKLGAVAQTVEVDGLQAVEEEEQDRRNLQQKAGRRLEKTISTRKHFQEEEASLALSAAMPGEGRGRGTRNLFEFSKGSLELSIFSAPKPKANNKEEFKSTLAASKTVVSKCTEKSVDSSKSSVCLGSSRSTDGSRSIGSKLSSIMRSKNDSKKLLKSEERVAELEVENQEFGKENKLLTARLNELAALIDKHNVMKEWQSFEELAKMTSEAWKFRSRVLSTTIEIENLQRKLAAYERLVESKERSICNLENVRHKQEKRIGYLEVQCLQNGIDIAEEGSVAPIKLIEKTQMKGRDDVTEDYEHSFASFQDDDHGVPVKIDYRQVQMKKLEKPSQSRDRDIDQLGRSSRSEDSAGSSMGISDLSGHSKTSVEHEITGRPDSWLTLDMAHREGESSVSPLKGKILPVTSGVALDSFLATASKDQMERCLETATWDPTNMLDFANRSPRDVGVTPPPPPPPATANYVRSAPTPTTRKSAPGIVISSSTRSKSPGTRRRLKDLRAESDPLTPSTLRGESSRSAGGNRSKSQGSRQKIKEATGAPGSGPQASSSSLNVSSAHCRKLETSTSFHKELDRSFNCGGKPRRRTKKETCGLDLSSTHSLGRGSSHRRRQRKECEFDRKAVSTALENALGSSLNVVDTEDYDVLKTFVPSVKARKASSANFEGNASFRVRSKASKSEQMDDEGLDLDDVFKD